MSFLYLANSRNLYSPNFRLISMVSADPNIISFLELSGKETFTVSGRSHTSNKTL